MPRVKGSMLAMVVKTIRGDQTRYLRSKVPAAHRDLVESMILSIHWYDFQVYRELVDFLVLEAARGDMQVVRQWGRLAAEQALGSVYQAVVTRGDAQATLRNHEGFFRRFFDFGDLELQLLGPGQALVSLVDFANDWEAIHMLFAGWLERAVQLAGADSVKVDLVARSWAGDPATRYKVSFRGAP